MSFFNSELVLEEMKEISELQIQISKNVFKFPQMSIQEKKDHLEKLKQLLSKQKIFYTRVSLSDDPSAQEMKNTFIESLELMGMSPNTDINIVFNNMTMMVENMQKELDKMSAD